MDPELARRIQELIAFKGGGYNEECVADIIENALKMLRDVEDSGDVTVGEGSSLWPQAVLRGDINAIVVGRQSNIQDGAILHVADDFACLVGDRVTVGHGAILHACTVRDEVLVGMRATVLDGAVVEPQCLIGAGALVTQGTHIPEGSLVLGVPGKVIRPLTADERTALRVSAEKYCRLAAFYVARRDSQKT